MKINRTHGIKFIFKVFYNYFINSFNLKDIVPNLTKEKKN